MWQNNPTIGIQEATFSYYGKIYNIHKTCKLTSLYYMVTQEMWARLVQKVKIQCTQVTIQLINKLDKIFFTQLVLNAQELSTCNIGCNLMPTKHVLGTLHCPKNNIATLG